MGNVGGIFAGVLSIVRVFGHVVKKQCDFVCVLSVARVISHVVKMLCDFVRVNDDHIKTV